MNGLENLSKMEYPGRFIIIGKDFDGTNLIVYGITARKKIDQARKLETGRYIVEDQEKMERIYVESTDENLLKKGNLDILLYDALFFGYGIAVSNGRQTNDIKAWMSAGAKPIDVLVKSLYKWKYEDDENKTPRISGCVINNTAALSIIKCKNNSVERQYFDFSLIPGKGKLITTYSGENIRPAPSFEGEPLDVEFNTPAPIEIAVNYSLSPKDPEKDFRVAVVCAYYDTEKSAVRIGKINRVDK